jgi:hypothetical protein
MTTFKTFFSCPLPPHSNGAGFNFFVFVDWPDDDLDFLLNLFLYKMPSCSDDHRAADTDGLCHVAGQLDGGAEEWAQVTARPLLPTPPGLPTSAGRQADTICRLH